MKYMHPLLPEGLPVHSPLSVALSPVPALAAPCRPSPLSPQRLSEQLSLHERHPALKPTNIPVPCSRNPALPPPCVSQRWGGGAGLRPALYSVSARFQCPPSAGLHPAPRSLECPWAPACTPQTHPTHPLIVVPPVLRILSQIPLTLQTFGSGLTPIEFLWPSHRLDSSQNKRVSAAQAQGAVSVPCVQAVLQVAPLVVTDFPGSLVLRCDGRLLHRLSVV